jgi:hypothetical protein
MVKQFFGSISFRFDFFASFLLFSVRFCFIFFLSQAIFRFIFVSLQFFRLFHVRFRFRFLLFRFDVKQAKSCLFFASKRNKMFASISVFASEAETRAHPSVDTPWCENVRKCKKITLYFFLFYVCVVILCNFFTLCNFYVF